MFSNKFTMTWHKRAHFNNKVEFLIEAHLLLDEISFHFLLWEVRIPILDYSIVTDRCTCHDCRALVSRVKYCRDKFITVWMKYDNSKWNGAKFQSKPPANLVTSQEDIIHNIRMKLMMASSNGNIFHVTGHLCGEFTGPRSISHTKASAAELWCFLWSPYE